MVGDRIAGYKSVIAIIASSPLFLEWLLTDLHSWSLGWVDALLVG